MTPPQVRPVPELASSLFRERPTPTSALVTKVRLGFGELAQQLAELMAPGPDAAAALRTFHVAYLQTLAALPESA